MYNSFQFILAINLDLLETASQIYTVTIPLHHFDAGCSLFIMHVILHGQIVPLLYSLIPNTSKSTYVRILEGARDLCQNLLPDQLIIDYDEEIMKAANKVFGNDVNIRGSRHSFIKKIEDVIASSPELHKSYYNTSNFKYNIKIRNLDALSYVPIQDVEIVYDHLIKSQFYVENSKVLEPIVKYFEEMFVGLCSLLPNSKLRRPPKFPIPMWNCHSTSLDSTTFINNSIDSWYRSFYSLINVQATTIASLLELLQIDQHSTEMRINEIFSNTVEQELHSDFDIKLIEIQKRYANSSKLDYLNHVALHFSLQSE